MTGVARRIQWLLPDPAREVYATARVVDPAAPVEGLRPGGPEGCVRCGAAVHRGDVVFSVRDRGTLYRHREVAVIHRRCVPTREFQTAGLPARKVRRA